MLKVRLFNREERPGNYSIEGVFSLIRNALADRVDFDDYQLPSRKHRFWHTLTINKHSTPINHITGDVHFLGIKLPSKSTIITVHDLGHFENSLHGWRRFVYKWVWLKWPLKNARYVTCISDFTRQKLVDIVGIPNEKITVIYNPLSPDIAFTPKEMNTREPVILQIGSGANKNRENLIKAVYGLNCKLVFIGPLSVNQVIMLKEHHVKYENYIDVSQSDLYEFYKKADIVYFASTYEGFGLPIIEAQGFGRPVITSDCASMPEVAGKGAILVNPLSTEAIREAITRITTDHKLSESLIKEGVKNVERFNVAKIASEYYKLYRKVGQDKGDVGINKPIVFLYSEVMPYTVACLKELSRVAKTPIHVVNWDHNKLTPYLPESSDGIRYYKRSAHTVSSLKELIDNTRPSMLYVVGRMDQGYLKVARYAKTKQIITVTGWDNQWEGSIRNYLACIASPLFYKRYFEYVMVAGIWQYEYVRRMGYKRQQIIFDQYSCDFNLFEEAFHARVKKNFPSGKKILFVGRLVETKGILLLQKAFNDLVSDGYRDWKLIIIGNGALRNQIKETDNTTVLQFSDQKSIAGMLDDINCFCLPSYKEPWGVVIHEMATAGIPLITSEVCGASTLFLKESYNGYSFRTGDGTDLKTRLAMIMNMSDEERVKMSVRSHSLARHITPEIWARNLMSVIPMHMPEVNAPGV